VLDHRQRRKRLLNLSSRLQAQAATAADSGNDEPCRIQVQAAMEKLKPADREVLQLVIWDGLSHVAFPPASHVAVLDRLVAQDVAAGAKTGQLQLLGFVDHRTRADRSRAHPRARGTGRGTRRGPGRESRDGRPPEHDKALTLAVEAN
jgi:hypothetical protein